jgi:hypothetical protein
MNSTTMLEYVLKQLRCHRLGRLVWPSIHLTVHYNGLYQMFMDSIEPQM